MNIPIRELNGMVHHSLTAEERERMYQTLVSLPVLDRAALVSRLLQDSGLGIGDWDCWWDKYFCRFECQF